LVNAWVFGMYGGPRGAVSPRLAKALGRRLALLEMVPDAGLEPATFGLQNRCSTS
jgi:hypothetical protein